MRSSLAEREVETIATLESSTFTIKQNYKAFKVLIDGLYSDKIRAVIRELWTNAYDSHVEAGRADQPFECHLPSRFAPHFAVRDFGVSLTHDGVMRLYTTVFESTKEDTNQQVGKLGLGSKSPFAYTDTFTVTAWLDGEKRTYSAYIGADHVPRIDFMGVEPSEDPQGLEVSFPVKPDDIGAFQTAAYRVAMGFDVPPTQTGNAIALTPLEVAMEGTSWRLLKNGSVLGSSKAHARQGCVIYPLDANAIPDLSDDQRAVLEAPVLIDFPIGDLEISANRESLGYDEPTCRNIRVMAMNIAAEVAAIHTGRISSYATYWEACKDYARQQDDTSLSRLVKTVTTAHAEWRGRKLKSTIRLNDFLDKYRVNLASGGLAALRLGLNDMGKRRAPRWEPSTYVEAYPKTDVVVFENVHDNIHAPGVRLQYACERNVIQGPVLWIKADPTSMAWKRLYVFLGRPPVIELSKLDKRPPDPTQSRRRNVKMRVLRNHPRAKLEETEIDEADEQIFFRMDRGDIIGPEGNKIGVSSAWDIVEQMMKVGALSRHVDVIGVPATHRNLPDKNPHWKCVWDIANEYLAANFDEKAAAYAAGARDFIKKPGDVFKFFNDVYEHGLEFAMKGPAHDALMWFADVKQMAAGAARVSEIRDLAACMRGYGVLLETIEPAGWREHEDMFSYMYPLADDMLRSTWVSDDRRNKLIDYVNFVDTFDPIVDTAANSTSGA